jgi:hypothetical protein
MSRDPPLREAAVFTIASLYVLFACAQTGRKMLGKLKCLLTGQNAEDLAWKEKGSGQKLGSAEPGAKMKPRPSNVQSSGAGQSVPPQPRASAQARAGSGPQPHIPTAQPRPSDAQQQAILEQVVMANTPTGTPCHSLSPNRALRPALTRCLYTHPFHPCSNRTARLFRAGIAVLGLVRDCRR